MSAFAFAAKTDRRIDFLPSEAYLRKFGTAKRLLEELLPLSRLALSLKLPGLKVFVTAHESDGPVDGRIEVSGFNPRQFDVEVTYAGYGQAEALRAELLSRTVVLPNRHDVRKPIVANPRCCNGASIENRALQDDEVISLADRIAEGDSERLASHLSTDTEQDSVEFVGWNGRYLYPHHLQA